MSSYSQAIGVEESAFGCRVRVSSLAGVLLPSLGAAVFAVTLVHVLFLSAGTSALFRDSDTGWHIRNGEAILQSATVPRADSFTYTSAGKAWVAWEWLSDAMLGAAHREAGLAGVAFLAALAIALAAWAFVRLTLSLGGNILLGAFAAGLMLGTTSIHWLARPHIFSWLMALLFLAIAERERNRPSRALYALPALACVWANLHASFPLGIGILALYAIGEWLRGRSGRPAGIRFAAAAVASLGATFINPFGWRLHEHVIAYLRDSYLMDHISEFRSFDFHSAGTIYVELFLAVAALGTVALFRQRAFGPALLALAMLHLSLYSARHVPTAAILLLPLSVAAITREAERIPRLRPLLDYCERLRAIDRKVSGAFPVIVVLATTLAVLVPVARAGRVGFDPAKFPVSAADFIERQGLDRRVFAQDQWSGYLLYRFDGKSKVFLDGRSDLYSRELLDDYAKVIAVKPGWDAVLRRYGVHFVLTPPENAVATVLGLSGEWKRVYGDPVAAVFERTE